MSFGPARLATEKAIHHRPAVFLLCGACKVNIMILEATFETEVFENKGGRISITQKQPNEEHQSVVLTTAQARLIAEELMRLASSIEECNALAEQENQENA